MFDSEKIYESLYANNTKEETEKEICRLYKLYCERLDEFKKAQRARWILTFVGIAAVFILVVCLFSQPSLDDILNAGIGTIGTVLLVACMFSAFYIFVNISIFGWLIQKIIAEDRRLDDIKKRIYVLEKKLED